MNKKMVRQPLPCWRAGINSVLLGRLTPFSAHITPCANRRREQREAPVPALVYQQCNAVSKVAWDTKEVLLRRPHTSSWAMHDEKSEATRDDLAPVTAPQRTLRTLSLVTVTFFCTAGGPYGKFNQQNYTNTKSTLLF